MSLLGNIWVKLGLKSDDYQRGMEKAHSRAERFGTAVGKIAGRMVIAWAAVGTAVTALFKKSIDNYNQQEAANRKLQNSLKNTGAAIGLNYQELREYASELQKVNNFADDATMSAMATLTTFRSVQGDVFKATIKAAQDMAAFMGTDLNTAVLQLGKALESPQVGMAALRRSGVVFSQEMQDGIKKLVNEGKQYEAQLLILEEVNKRFGGAAASQADTAAGKWKQVGLIFSDLTEYIGKSSEASRGLASGLADALQYAERIISSESLSGWRKFFALIGFGRDKTEELLNIEDEEAARRAGNIKKHVATVMSGVTTIAQAKEKLTKQEEMLAEAEKKGWSERAAEAKGAVDALNAFIAKKEDEAERDRQRRKEEAERYQKWREEHEGLLNGLKDEIAAKEKLLNMAKDPSEITKIQKEIKALELKRKLLLGEFDTGGKVKIDNSLTNNQAEKLVGLDSETLGKELDAVIAEQEDFLKEFEAQKERAEAIANEFGQAIQQGVVSAIDELAEAIGTGDWDTGALVKALLSPIADACVSAGVMILSTGEAVEAFKTALESLNGYAALAAGAALIAVGTAAKIGLAALAKNTRAGVNTPNGSAYTYTGGYGVAPAYANNAGMLEIEGHITVKGQDLDIALTNYNKNRKR